MEIAVQEYFMTMRKVKPENLADDLKTQSWVPVEEVKFSSQRSSGIDLNGLRRPGFPVLRLIRYFDNWSPRLTPDLAAMPHITIVSVETEDRPKTQTPSVTRRPQVARRKPLWLFHLEFCHITNYRTSPDILGDGKPGEAIDIVYGSLRHHWLTKEGKRSMQHVLSTERPPPRSDLQLHVGSQ